MTETMTVTVTATIERVTFDDLLDSVSTGVDYWGTIERDGDVFKVASHDGEHTATITWQKLADTLALMASGVYLNYGGVRTSLATYQENAARDLLFDPSNADWDSETIDCLIQMAAFDAVIYG